MATVISKNAFVDYDGKTKVKFDNIYVEYQSTSDGEIKRDLIKNLYVKGSDPIRKIKSYAEFVKKLALDEVATGPSGVQTVKTFSKDVKPQILGVKAPEKYTTISVDAQDEQVPYGLRRTLEVQEVNNSTQIEDRYYYVQIKGEDEFLKPETIYFYDKSNKKRILSEIKNPDILKDVDLYAPNGEKIDMVYTEKEYVFPATLASEKIDFARGERIITEKIKTTDEDGKETYKTSTTAEKLDKYFSEQAYVRKEIENERRPGKTKEVSLIEVKNFQLQPDGEYHAVKVDGFTQLVHKDNLVDINGNKIENLANLVGNSVNVIIDGNVVATTDPLTYQQANLTYSTIKTYQETKKEVGDDTYLRLKNGEYVKETEAIKPISYKVVDVENAQYDAFLVKTTALDGTEKYVIVGKDYFIKNGDTTEIKQVNAVKIKRCAFDSKDCAVVQTTSKGTKIEQCSIVKKSKILGKQVAVDEKDKDTAFEAFMTGYIAGEYLLKDVCRDDKVEELSARRERYELSDTSYLEDYADNLHQYRSLKVDDIRIVNGKLVGGSKFDIGKGIKNSFKTLGKMAGPAALIWGSAGILIPVVGPMISAAIVATYVASVPGVPIFNALYGAVKNSKRTKFMDKAGYNQQVEMLSVEKRLKKLYERMTDKDFVPYPEARFEDEYNKIVNDIISLSSCSVKNALIVENGVAKVTPENAAAAKAYMAEFKKTKTEKGIAINKCQKARIDFEKYESRIKQLENEGRRIPESLQKDFDKFKAIYEQKKKVSDDVSAHFESLLNYKGNPTELAVHAERDRLLKVASVMRTAVYFKSEVFKDHPLVQEALYGEKGLTDATDLLTEEDLALDDKSWTQEEIDAYRKANADKSMKMLENIEMDFKNGLMVDGIGVGLNDEDIAYMPEYARGYQWVKVKQAIEFVHNGLKPKEAELVNEEPSVNTDEDKNSHKSSSDDDATKNVTKKKRLNSSIITSENNVAKELEDSQTETYKSVMRLLTKKNSKFLMTKEEAAKTIFNVAQQINHAHDLKMHAKDMFEKDSVEYYILTSSLKKMTKLVTQNYTA